MYISPRIEIGKFPNKIIFDNCRMLGWHEQPRTPSDPGGGDVFLFRSNDGTRFFSVLKTSNGFMVNAKTTELDEASAAALLETIRQSATRFVWVNEVNALLPE